MYPPEYSINVAFAIAKAIPNIVNLKIVLYLLKLVLINKRKK